MRQAITLEVVHNNKKTRLQLRVGPSQLVIGRGDDADPVDIDLTPFNALESGVSRQHAHLIRKPDGIYLTDQNSKNGTYINGFQLTSGEPYRLRHDDEITFGQLRTVVRLD